MGAGLGFLLQLMRENWGFCGFVGSGGFLGG